MHRSTFLPFMTSCCFDLSSLQNRTEPVISVIIQNIPYVCRSVTITRINLCTICVTGRLSWESTLFQSLSVFIFGISLRSVDSGVFGMWKSPGRSGRRDGRSGDTWRLFARRTARRREVFAWDGASASDAAPARLSHCVLTRPSCHLLLSLNKFITRKQ